MSTPVDLAKKVMDLQIDISMRNDENCGLRNLVADLTQALLNAEAHVHRQELMGNHEQNKLDASAWLEKNRELMRELKGDG